MFYCVRKRGIDSPVKSECSPNAPSARNSRGSGVCTGCLILIERCKYHQGVAISKNTRDCPGQHINRLLAPDSTRRSTRAHVTNLMGSVMDLFFEA